MSESAAEETAEFRLVPPSPTADAPSLYANFAQATVTQYDMTLFFGLYRVPPLQDRPTETVEVPIEPLVRVTLPIGVVQAVIDVMQRQLASWRDSFQAASMESDKHD